MNTSLNSTAFQIRSITSLAAIFSTRLLGLFLILPIFALYTHKLLDATPNLIGIALGIYGLTQAIFQIPLATWSDKIGRKPVILFGLLIFIAGSVLAALSTSIYGIIIGRALQGAGAIGSTTIALVADLTTVENRTKGMAVIGMSIGVSFALAMMMGPLLNYWIGLSGIFWTTAMLGVLSIGLLLSFVPRPPKFTVHADRQISFSLFKRILIRPELLRLNVGIFILHALLTASFVVIPLLLTGTEKISASQTWLFYLPIFLIAFMIVIPCIMISEKFRQVKSIFCAAILALALTQFFLGYFNLSVLAVGVTLTVFFTAFTFLESTLPSLISKIAPVEAKGTAIGVYSTAQFLGMFVGGSIGGWLYHAFGLNTVFYLGAILATVWFLIAITMSEPPYLNTLMVSVRHLTSEEAAQLSALLNGLKGMNEAAVMTQENVVYLKIDRRVFDREALDVLLKKFQ